MLVKTQVLVWINTAIKTHTKKCSFLIPGLKANSSRRPREVRRRGKTSTEPRSIQIRKPRADPAHRLNLKRRIAESIRFPFDGFTYFLTLFSKFFSSFPHGTCSLSVSRQYLALDGVYHPFWAAFPNNPTLCMCK